MFYFYVMQHSLQRGNVFGITFSRTGKDGAIKQSFLRRGHGDWLKVSIYCFLYKGTLCVYVFLVKAAHYLLKSGIQRLQLKRKEKSETSNRKRTSGRKEDHNP